MREKPQYSFVHHRRDEVEEEKAKEYKFERNKRFLHEVVHPGREVVVYDLENLLRCLEELNERSKDVLKVHHQSNIKVYGRLIREMHDRYLNDKNTNINTKIKPDDRKKLEGYLKELSEHTFDYYFD